MTTTPLNPYGTSTTILEAERFFGRTEALDYLYSEIIARRCVSIVGTRRIGKSSLLRCIVLPEIQQRFASVYDLQKHLLVYIDLGEFLTDTVQDFLDEVCRQLLAQSRPGLVLQAPQEEDSPDKLRSLLDQIQEQGFHTVLLFDAFHKITYNTHFDASFFSFLRAQANHGRVSYITASITPLDTCCHPYIEGSPFFNIFGVYHLGALDNHEAHQLITEPARACGDPFSEQDVEEILALAGRHPFFIQRVACLLFREKNQRHQARQENRLWLRQEAYRDLLPHFKDIWENSLNYQQREILREEAHWKHVRQRRLPELAESALFRKFVRETCNIKSVDITVDTLEGILNNLNNTRFLGECELTHLYLFSVRSQHLPIPHSVNEKGVIVRRILQEARDRLRPEGEPSDTAPEWQHYNILNYRFFKDRMKNEPLADLLGISVRHLHRERRQALEALHEMLHEMETTAKEDLERYE